MEIERISREFIRPSSETPTHLRLYRLSFFDHVNCPYYLPMVFLYSKTECCSKDIVETSSKLKNYLSEALVRYYPLAGRIKDRFSIDCNDEGALYVEARVKNRSMKSVLDSSADPDCVESLFPEQLQWSDMGMDASLLAIQVNYFECGGMAIGVCMSHKFGDTSTMTHFIRDWAAIKKNIGEEIPFPALNAGSIFSHDGLPTIPNGPQVKTSVCRRFIFDSSKIHALKALVSSKIENPTRVQVVSALIYKCAVSAFQKSNTESKKATLIPIVNLRSRVVPPLPENAAGNIFLGYSISTTGEVLSLPYLVNEMKESLSQFCEKYAKRFRGEEWHSAILEYFKEALQVTSEKNQFIYGCSSWCRFPVYEVDFGWGKPTWVTTAASPMQTIILMDSRDGNGVEAIVSLPEEYMEIFTHDEDLLAYCSM